MFRSTFTFLATTLSSARLLMVGLAATSFFAGFGATQAAAQSGYALQPGDVVRVEVLEDPSLNRSTLVLPDGSINFPQAGSIRAAGLTVEQVQQALTGGLSANFATPPTVYASVASLAPPALPMMGGAVAEGAIVNGINVYVMGEVSDPGLKEVVAGTNLLQFMAQAGNVGNFAARKRIELHRMDASTGTGRVYVFDLNKVGGGANRISGMTQLTEGDVVVVPQRRLFE